VAGRMVFGRKLNQGYKPSNSMAPQFGHRKKNSCPLDFSNSNFSPIIGGEHKVKKQEEEAQTTADLFNFT